MKGVSGYGVYVPWRRLNRRAIAEAHAWCAPALKSLGRGSKAIAHWDEDAITMGTEAARGCCTGTAGTPKSIVLASTGLPFSDRQNAGLIKEALDLDDFTETADLTGSQRAATTGLISALRQPVDTLCVAAEKSRAKPMSEAELTSGDAAVALRLSDHGVIAEFLAAESLSLDFVDHYQTTGGTSYQWESRWVRDEGYAKLLPRTFRALMEKAGVSPGDIAHFAFESPLRGLQVRIAKALGLADGMVSGEPCASLGYVGCAQPLMQFVHALENAKPGDIILLAAFGQGCDLLLFRVTDEIANYTSPAPFSPALARQRVTDNYLKYLVLNEQLAVDYGMRSEQDQKTPLTALYRERKTVLGLVGGRCRETGMVQFPKSEVMAVGDQWVRGTQEDYRLADLPARIVTFTEDYLAFTTAPPYAYGTIEFEGGGRMVAEFVDYAQGDLYVGAPVRMVFRIKVKDPMRDFPRYFWKATPAERAE